MSLIFIILMLTSFESQSKIYALLFYVENLANLDCVFLQDFIVLKADNKWIFLSSFLLVCLALIFVKSGAGDQEWAPILVWIFRVSYSLSGLSE